MRIKPGADDLLERLAISLNLAPLPGSDAKRERASAAALGLFFQLTSGAELPSPGELRGYLREAGFGGPKRVKIRRIPDQNLYQAKAI